MASITTTRRAVAAHSSTHDDENDLDTVTAPSTPTQQQENQFQELLNDNQRAVLDAVDSLRAHKLSADLPLPEIVVCGGQSTGKSSVLEAISKVPFPKDQQCCTRFATEIALRRDKIQSMKISISPGASRSVHDTQRLKSFDETMSDFSELPILLEKAKTVMGIGIDSNSESQFSEDILKIEVSGPEQPQLTLVDLPGLISSTGDRQSKGDVRLVRKLVERYMQRPTTVILAVVPAEGHWQTHDVLNLVTEFDTNGERTLGIITKPDRLKRGSASEKEWLSLARNQEKQLKLGWHVVKNIDSDDPTLNSSMMDRDRLESKFFSVSRFQPDAATKLQVGISSLRTRLSSILFQKIQEALPQLIAEVNKRIPIDAADLEKLGKERITQRDLVQFLNEKSFKFMDLCNQALEARYRDEFFVYAEISPPRGPAEKRLCSTFMKLYDSFEKQMRSKGSQHSLPDWSQEDAGDFLTPENHKYQTLITRTQEIWMDCRGRELPGQSNPEVIPKLFHECSSPWREIADSFIVKAYKIIKAFINSTLEHICDERTALKLRRFWFEDRLQGMRSRARAKLDMLIKSNRGPLTPLQPKFLEKSRTIARTMASYLAQDEENYPKVAQAATTVEMLFTMVEYYKIACDTFIMNVPQLVLEPMLEELKTIFTIEEVHVMSEDLIFKIAQEPDSIQEDRARISNRLTFLSQKKIQLDELAFATGADPLLPTADDMDEDLEIGIDEPSLPDVSALEVAEVRAPPSGFGAPPSGFGVPPSGFGGFGGSSGFGAQVAEVPATGFGGFGGFGRSPTPETRPATLAAPLSQGHSRNASRDPSPNAFHGSRGPSSVSSMSTFGGSPFKKASLLGSSEASRNGLLRADNAAAKKKWSKQSMQQTEIHYGTDEEEEEI